MVESVFESTMLKAYLVTLSHSLDMLQVLALLGLDRASADPETAELCLGYSTMHMAIYAACVGSYLTDMLHMRCLDCSPMSAQDPDTFLMACQGTSISCRGRWHPGFMKSSEGFKPITLGCQEMVIQAPFIMSTLILSACSCIDAHYISLCHELSSCPTRHCLSSLSLLHLHVWHCCLTPSVQMLSCPVRFCIV